MIHYFNDILNILLTRRLVLSTYQAQIVDYLKRKAWIVSLTFNDPLI